MTTTTRSYGPVTIRDYGDGTASAYQTEYVNGVGRQLLLCELSTSSGYGGTYTRVLDGLTMSPLGRVRRQPFGRFEAISEDGDTFHLRGTFDTIESAILAVTGR